ncbi:MAG: class B sortase [Lachnospiraceae bacterium]|jgi:sortase, SrtB family|nr:class B sortase [Lachnospiraceae bacterium]
MGRLQDIEDEKLKAAVIRELEKREKRRKRLIGLCIVLATGCIGYFSVYTYMNRKTQDESGKWAQMKEESRKKPGDKKDELVIHRTTGDVEVPDILPEYESLYNINKRLIGWVKIADIDIDYPVMQTVDNEYYLDHDFGQNYDKNGCIFMDKDCDVIDRSTNLIIYGHHMKSGAMFGQLDKYADESFYQEHQTFQFDTIYEKGTYQVAYAFQAQVLPEDEVAFKYYQFIDVNSEAEFNSNIAAMAEMSLYNTGITPVYGDELVTLSTCDRSQGAEGRFVVVGVKIA